jgi:hypothetical protein
MAVFVAAGLLCFIFFQMFDLQVPLISRIEDIAFVWGLMAFWTLVVTAIPAGLFIYYSEGRSWRSLWLYALAGTIFSVPLGASVNFIVFVECGAIGAVAGLTYWLIAGRFAGLQGKASA